MRREVYSQRATPGQEILIRSRTPQGLHAAHHSPLNRVLRANHEIFRQGLAPHTFGSFLGSTRSGSEPLVVIKPSGVDYEKLTPETWL